MIARKSLLVLLTFALLAVVAVAEHGTRTSPKDYAGWDVSFGQPVPCRVGTLSCFDLGTEPFQFCSLGIKRCEQGVQLLPVPRLGP